MENIPSPQGADSRWHLEEKYEKRGRDLKKKEDRKTEAKRIPNIHAKQGKNANRHLEG
jgi:hypothetical protein